MTVARTTITGTGKLTAKLRRIPHVVAERARTAVAEETAETADDMRSLAPVDTGALVEGIQEEITDGGNRGTVASTAPHSQYVNGGTRKQDAQPFATTAGDMMVERFPGRVRRAVAAGLRTVSK